MYTDIKIGDKLYPHPLGLQENEWLEDLKQWPPTESPQVIVYLLKSKACDLREMEAYRSLDSYNYLISGWVGRVLFKKIDNDLCYLKTDVTPSQSISNNHTAWVCIHQRDGTILSAGCTCMAGLGKACSHAGALLWKIDFANKKGLTGQACTDTAAMWNCGTKRNIEPSLLKDTVFKKFKSNLNEVNFHSKSYSKPDFSQTLTHEEFLDHLDTCGLKGFAALPGTILQKTVSVNCNSEVQCVSTNLPDIHDHSDVHLLPFKCRPCLNFYQKYICLSPGKITILQDLTLMQSRSDMWLESRKLRITASTASKIPKTSRSDHMKYLRRHIFHPFLGNEFTKYGIKNEEFAIVQFCKKTGMDVQKSGTVVCESDCWLSGSPDGLVDSHAILEVKCPVPGSFNLKKMDLLDINGDIKINEKGSRGYYTQIQLTMHCTKRNTCYFFVWRSDGDDILTEVEYDQKFVNNMLPRLRAFYYQNMLPMLVKEVQNNKLSISNTYECFVKE